MSWEETAHKSCSVLLTSEQSTALWEPACGRLFPLFKHLHLIPLTSLSYGFTHKYQAMWEAITVLFCFPWAQRLLTSRQADRKGVQSRWIGPVTDTTLIAGTRVSNCPYKTTGDISPGLCKSFYRFDLQDYRSKRTGWQCWVQITTYRVCQYYVGH